jgi:hypothetical protein
MYATRLYTLIEAKYLYSSIMLHDFGATGGGIPIQALPMTHLTPTYVFKTSLRFY